MKIVRRLIEGLLCFLLVSVLVLVGIVTTIKLTILNPGFVVAELDKLDIYSVMVDQISAQLPGEELLGADTLESMTAELEPWLEEQVSTVIYAGYAYLKDDQELNVVISLEPVRSVVEENIRQVALESLPPELEGASESVMEGYLSELYGGAENMIPENYVLDESSLPPEIMGQLEQVRGIVGYVGPTYRMLVGLAVLLVLLVALVHWWQPKAIARPIGIVFGLVGISFTLTALLSRFTTGAISRLGSQSDILSELQPRLSQLVTDVMAPLQMYGVGFLGAGIALVVISLVLKSPEAYVPPKRAY